MGKPSHRRATSAPEAPPLVRGRVAVFAMGIGVAATACGGDLLAEPAAPQGKADHGGGASTDGVKTDSGPRADAVADVASEPGPDKVEPPPPTEAGPDAWDDTGYEYPPILLKSSPPVGVRRFP